MDRHGRARPKVVRPPGGGVITTACLTLVCAAVISGCEKDASDDASRSGSQQSSSSPPPNVVLAAPIQHVTVADMSMGYRVIGPLAGDDRAKSETMILIMGFSGTMDMWSPRLVERLARERRVIVFDNRGIGETDDPGGQYAFGQLADDTAGLIAALGYDRVDVLGWSMGGNVALDLAVRHPAVVDQLVVYAGDAGGTLTVQPSPGVYAAMTDTSGSPEEHGKQLLEMLFPKGWREAHPDYWQTFPEVSETAAPTAVDRQTAATESWRGVWRRLRAIASPTLVVTGTDDILTPPQNATMIADRVPGAWLARFAGAGHGLMYQYPEGLAETIETFLEVTEPEAE